TITFLPQLAFVFMMVFARVAMIAMLMPGIGAESVPTRIRLTIALLITLLLVPIVGDLIPPLPGTVFHIFFLMFLEIVVGLFIGMTAVLITSALQTAGSSIAFQTSLSAAQNTDLSTAVQGTLVSNFLSVVSLTLIFVMNVHHLVIAAMHDSYTLFKPGEIMPVGDVVAAGVDTFAQAFLIGVQLSAPFIVVGFVFNVGVGILSRLMPQFQVFLVLLPANIMIGFFLMFALIGTMMMWYMEHLETALSVFIVR
ncbi:MAG: flagellar biosynthetic protein FliR, partial [Pseudomonadota bacterium]